MADSTGLKMALAGCTQGVGFGVLAVAMLLGLTRAPSTLLVMGIAATIALVQFLLWFYVGSPKCSTLESLKATAVATVITVGLIALALIAPLRSAAAGIYRAVREFGKTPAMVDVSGCTFPCPTSATLDPELLEKETSQEFAAAVAYLGLFGAMIGYGVGDRFVAACA